MRTGIETPGVAAREAFVIAHRTRIVLQQSLLHE